jgi:hypothetical protein
VNREVIKDRDHEFVERPIHIGLVDGLHESAAGLQAKGIQLQQSVPTLLQTRRQFLPGGTGLGNQLIQFRARSCFSFVKILRYIVDPRAELFQQFTTTGEILLE